MANKAKKKVKAKAKAKAKAAPKPMNDGKCTALWARLIMAAVRNPVLREEFIRDSDTVIAKQGITCTKADHARIPQIKEALGRFGSDEKLDVRDASNWTIGLLHHQQNTLCSPPPEI